MNINHNSTEADMKNIDVKSQLEHQIQIQETEEGGWFFDKINSRKLKIYKTGELKRSVYVENPLRSNAISKKKENIDKYCFLWSTLA